jgi:hypothetical protein
MPLSDVVAMDIYPVPEGNGHSALTANPGLTAVGAYADILRDLVDRGGHPQPFAMVLLGAGLGRIPLERWEILENFADAYDMAGTEARGAVACDIDADDEAEIVIAGTTVGGQGVVRAYDFGASPFGDKQVEADAPADLAMSGLRYLLCADDNGDHRKDVVLVVDGGPTRQDVWVATANFVGFETPSLRWRASDPDVVLSVVRHAVAGDFDGDGCDDLLFTYDYPGDRQTFFAIPSGCAGFPAAATYPSVSWYETTTATLDLEAWPLAAAGDFNGDGRADLALVDTSPSFTVRIRLAANTGRFFGARDPTVPELRYMWLSTLAHGAAAVISWGQQFAAATDVAWSRLSGVATQLRALAPHLAGETLLRSTAPGRYMWWVNGTDLSLQLVVLNDQRSHDVVGVGASLPPGRTGTSVLVWSPSSRSFASVSGVSLSGTLVSDLRPLDPYEVRVYKVVE